MNNIFYGIKDRTTGSVWSRNRFGEAHACPDLYLTRKNAQHQIDKGKISLSKRYRPELDPVVVEYSVTEIVP